jgi:hypothetical protein
MEGYESLFKQCLAVMDGPLPKACLKTWACRMAGACPLCYAELLAAQRRLKFEVHTIEEHYDRQEDHRLFGRPLPRTQ